MAVKAWLEGHQFDLQDLAEMLSHGNVRVLHDPDEDAYYLIAPEIDQPPQPGRFDIPAKQLLPTINGLGRARRDDFEPVKLADRYTDHDGRTHTRLAPATAQMRLRGGAAAVVIGRDGQRLPSPPSPWPQRLALAETNQQVARVLRILGRDENPDWYDLYKVHEIVRHDIGARTVAAGRREIKSLGWATESQDRAFTESANRYDVSGEAARHAVDRHPEPASDTMTISEGRAYIANLATQWLDYRVGDG